MDNTTLRPILPIVLLALVGVTISCSAVGDKCDCGEFIRDAGECPLCNEPDSGVDGDISPPVEAQESLCQNGIDDDGNGHTDCDDWWCSLNVLHDVCEVREPLCEDNLDNDEDGYTDCADRDCRWHPATNCPCLEGGECNDQLCSDGIDNNGDGHIDCGDWECLFNWHVHICDRPIL